MGNRLILKGRTSSICIHKINAKIKVMLCPYSSMKYVKPYVPVPTPERFQNPLQPRH